MKFRLRLIVKIWILLLIRHDDSDAYYMERYCGKELSMIEQNVHQLQLEFNVDYMFDTYSHAYLLGRRRTCEATIKAGKTKWKKLMFYFEDLNLDCNDGYLVFYSGRNNNKRIKGLEKDICGDVKPDGVFTIDSRYLRIYYVPNKNSQFLSDVFSIIATSYDDGPCPGYGFQCDNSRCIDKDLKCNEYNSCGDDSGCEGTSVGAIIGITIGCLAGLGISVCAITCCVCCLRKGGKSQETVEDPPPQRVAYTASGQHVFIQPTYDVNQSGGYGVSPSSQLSYPAGPQAGPPTSITTGQALPTYSDDWTKPPPYEQIPISDHPPSYAECVASSQY